MLPPVDPEILSANPQFDALYRDLCTNKLKEDGTTKVDAKAQKERDAFKEELRKARVAAAKQNLIKSYLSSLSYRGDDLPSELQELVGIIAATLNARLSKEDANLLRDDVEKFKENIALIALVVSHAAAEDITALARLLTPSSSKTPDWRAVPSQIQSLQTSMSQSRSDVTSTRLELIHLTTQIHTLYRQGLETAIRTLEQTLHGSVARATKAKAEYLATVSKAMSAKVQVQLNGLLAQTASEEVGEALRGRIEGLEREGMALRRKVREAEGVLEDYVAGGWEGVAREYVEILREMERVRGEVERLEGRER